jgi:5-formyltetrahydrofolate cyclo-ligase
MSPFFASPLVPDLSSLRRYKRTERRRLSPQQQRLHSRIIARRLRGDLAFRRAERVAVYWAADGEVDLAPVIADLFARGKRCYLPVLRKQRPARLWFVAYRPRMRLGRNRFGIAEPPLPQRAITPPWALDIVLVPLVAFDPQGRRLGMGGGFYDRTFAYLRRHTYRHRPDLMGIAHACQRVDELPERPWDIPLRQVLTEYGRYLAGGVGGSGVTGRLLAGRSR